MTTFTTRPPCVPSVVGVFDPGPVADSTVDEPELRYRALVALKKEILPRTPAQRIWGGHGCGKSCPVCGCLVEPAQLEFEVEFAAADGGDAVREFHLHLRCFAVWETVKESLATARA
jgi:hypothetical protein